MITKIKSVPCSDWHLTWGLGANKLGKLSKIDDNKYRWVGNAQGRHGQKLRTKWLAEFEFIDGEVINATDSLPSLSEVLKSIQQLN